MIKLGERNWCDNLSEFGCNEYEDGGMQRKYVVKYPPAFIA